MASIKSINSLPIDSSPAHLVGVSSGGLAVKVLFSGAGLSMNNIGLPGAVGFGVGVCPALPAGYTANPGANEKASPSYGNYTYGDGSVMVWVPAFFYRIGHAGNPTFAAHGASSISILPISAYADQAGAQADGYVLHRAFIDGGQSQMGVFVDKYSCSNNGGIASSRKGFSPLSTGGDHNPISTLNNAPENNYGGTLKAAKSRGGRFFVTSRFIYAALAMLATAHAQASTGAAYCAWFDASGNNNAPKGNNNNALHDADDSSVVFTGDGYSACALTGSGAPFAKTTHNGQECGIADLNGNMWEVSPGMTCRATHSNITGLSKSNPAVVTTANPHDYQTGDIVGVYGPGGMSEFGDRMCIITVIDATRFSLNGVDSSGYSAYTNGGWCAGRVSYHVVKPSIRMADLTAGNNLATDHWGATGVAANFETFAPALKTAWPDNACWQLFGNGSNAVLGAAASGNEYALTGLGLTAAGGASSGGANAFGRDLQFQFATDEVCLLSGGVWNYWSHAGVWAVHLYAARGYSNGSVGFRAASYL